MNPAAGPAFAQAARRRPGQRARIEALVLAGGTGCGPAKRLFRGAGARESPGALSSALVQRMKGKAVLVSSYISPKARKGRPSAIEGRGLVAVAPIAKDELVAIKGGHIVDTPTLHSLPARLRNSEVQIADGFHLVALEEAEYEPVMLFINHSCEPNVGFAGNTVLAAMRDISPDEELTTDYALFDDYDSEMQCQCGTASCRGTISGRDWQRPQLQLKYGNYFSSYLLPRLNPQSGGR